MRSIDFTHEGGFPLTQDTLAWLQTAYTEVLQAIGSIGGTTGPFIISGCGSAGSSGLEPGWIYFNGELLYFLGGSPGAVILPNVLVAVISDTGTNLTFNNSSTPGVMRLRVLVLAGGSNTTTTSQFPWGTIKDFYTSFGLQARESAFSTLVVNTGAGNGNITGNLKYKLNKVANTLQIWGSLNASTPGDFGGAAAAVYLSMGTLAASYRPANIVPFLALVSSPPQPEDDAGVDYLRQLNAYIAPGGQVNIEWIKPGSGSSLQVLINAVIPLD